MNNKKIAIFIFILMAATFAAVLGAFATLGGNLNANILFDQLANGKKVATIKGTSTESNFEKCGKFNDIPATASYCWLTRTMRDHNIFTGDSNGNFRPNDPVSRAELAKILVIALYGSTVNVQDYTTLDGLQLGFRDVSNGIHWSFPYIKIAKEKGLINGYPDGTFRRDNWVTRAEFAKMLYSQLPDLQNKINEARSYVYGRWPNPEASLGLKQGQWYTDYLMMMLFADSRGTFLQDCGGKICADKAINRIEIAGAIEKLNSVYNMPIGSGANNVPGDITSQINSSNCLKIKKLQNMTATLSQLGINTGVITSCANAYPNLFTQNHPAATSDITGDLSAENCLKISRLNNITGTLQNLNVNTNLISQCANNYHSVWDKCNTLYNWKKLYGQNGLSSQMSSANPKFTSEDATQCANKFGAKWNSDITEDLSFTNCQKIRQLGDMTATLQNMGINTGLISQCASTYYSYWQTWKR